MGEWGRGTWAVRRATFMLTREETAQLIAEQQQLIERYRREPANTPAGARAVAFGFLVYPQAPRDGAQGPGEPAGPGI
jgi:hypothetical protein